MRFIFFGPPGAGKGTQAQKLCQRLGVPQISTGEILRAEKRKGSALGLTAAKLIDDGKFVPDDVAIGIIDARIQRQDCANGYVLDGFPRTVPQAETLAEILAQRAQAIDHVINLVVPDSLLVQRLIQRRSCSQCGRIYHLEFSPPTSPGLCDDDGAKLLHRADDREQAIRQRLQIFHAQSAALIAYYQQRGLLREILGDRHPDQVFARICETLEQLSPECC